MYANDTWASLRHHLYSRLPGILCVFGAVHQRREGGQRRGIHRKRQKLLWVVSGPQDHLTLLFENKLVPLLGLFASARIYPCDSSAVRSARLLLCSLVVCLFLCGEAAFVSDRTYDVVLFAAIRPPVQVFSGCLRKFGGVCMMDGKMNVSCVTEAVHCWCAHVTTIHI